MINNQIQYVDIFVAQNKTEKNKNEREKYNMKNIIYGKWAKIKENLSHWDVVN